MLQLVEKHHSPLEWSGVWLKLMFAVAKSGNPATASAMIEAKELRGREADEALALVQPELGVSAWKQLLSDALDTAVRRGDEGMADRLLQAEAWIGSAIEIAAIEWQWETVLVVLKHYVSRGAAAFCIDLTGEDDVGAAASTEPRPDLSDALELAAQMGVKKVVEALMCAGAKSEVALHAATRNTRLSAMKVILELSPVDVLNTDGTGQTPLHVASSIRTLKLLLSNGAHVNATDDQGRTPLHKAVDEWLDAEDADDWYPQGCVAALVEKGADLNAAEEDGQTPLHIATSRLNVRGVSELLWHGGVETIRDDMGLTARDATGVQYLPGDTRPTQIRLMLDNAPKDRAWRRRKLVLAARLVHTNEWVNLRVGPGGQDDKNLCWRLVADVAPNLVFEKIMGYV